MKSNLLFITIICTIIVQFKSNKVLINNNISINNSTAIRFDSFRYQNLVVQIGTPPQTFLVLLNLGCSISWMALTGVPGITNQFNSSASSTFRNTSQSLVIQYVSFSQLIKGYIGSDILRIPQTPIAVNQSFLWASQANIQINPQISGNLGMGYTDNPNFLDIAFQNNLINTSDFIYSLASFHTNKSSFLYFNQLPQTIITTSVFVDVIGINNYWSVDLIGLSIGQNDMSSITPQLAIFDSPSYYLYLSSQLFDFVNQTYFSNCIIQQNSPQCLCSDTYRWPNFTFYFDGIQLFIQPNQYIFPINQTYCTYLIGVVPPDYTNYIILGHVFFTGYNITFSKLTKRIGFSGNLKYLHKIVLFGSNIIEYILFVVLILMIIIGFVQFWKLRQSLIESQDSEFDVQITNCDNKQLLIEQRVNIS